MGDTLTHFFNAQDLNGNTDLIYSIKTTINELLFSGQKGKLTWIPKKEDIGLHNLEINELSKSLKEIERVSSKNSFITVDAYRNTKEKTNMESWNLTAKTMLHVDEWKKLFESSGYKGDYCWFIP